MGHTKEDFPEYFLKNVKKPLAMLVPLRDYSNFKIGGRADFFFEAASVQELVASILSAREASVPFYVIGGGYNLLFDDAGFRGLIIKNNVKGIQKRKSIPEVEVFAGTSLEELLRFSVKEGLSGLEFMSGIPGTVGGAVYGNAGAFKKSIGEFVKEALLLDRKGEQVQVERDYFEFRYRHSILKKKHDVLLSVVVELCDGEKESIKALIEENLEKRKEKHPPHDLPCAGSYFKNPVLPDGRVVPAAYFLERVGARKMKIGGAAVYSGHSNFIFNQEKASAQDVFRLAQKLKRRVKERFAVELEEEVIFLPAGPSAP
jgi:UDP-N-acetylmuramate dehydrogenase